MLKERLVSVLINNSGRTLKSDNCRIMLNRLTDMVSTYRKWPLQIKIGSQSAGKDAAWCSKLELSQAGVHRCVPKTANTILPLWVVSFYPDVFQSAG